MLKTHYSGYPHHAGSSDRNYLSVFSESGTPLRMWTHAKSCDIHSPQGNPAVFSRWAKRGFHPFFKTSRSLKRTFFLSTHFFIVVVVVVHPYRIFVFAFVEVEDMNEIQNILTPQVHRVTPVSPVFNKFAERIDLGHDVGC